MFQINIFSSDKILQFNSILHEENFDHEIDIWDTSIRLFDIWKNELDISRDRNVQRKLLVSLYGLHTNVSRMKAMDVPTDGRKKGSAFFR